MSHSSCPTHAHHGQSRSMNPFVTISCVISADFTENPWGLAQLAQLSQHLHSSSRRPSHLQEHLSFVNALLDFTPSHCSPRAGHTPSHLATFKSHHSSSPAPYHTSTSNPPLFPRLDVPDQPPHPLPVILPIAQQQLPTLDNLPGSH